MCFDAVCGSGILYNLTYCEISFAVGAYALSMALWWLFSPILEGEEGYLLKKIYIKTYRN